MSDPDRLTSHDDQTFGLDTRGLILRTIVVAFLAALFWQAIIAAGRLRRSIGRVSAGIDCFRQDKFIVCGCLRQTWISKVGHPCQHLINRRTDGRTREIASGRGVELILMSSM
jgi:hypothetical protein